MATGSGLDVGEDLSARGVGPSGTEVWSQEQPLA
jgi:hypothetical protein